MASRPLDLTYADIVASIALLLAIVNLALILWDRRPRLRISAEQHFHDEWEEDLHEPVLVAKRLWIDITNVSPRRIWVSQVSAEWRRRRWLPSRRYKLQPSDLQRWENQTKEPVSRFWIEPWGSALLSADLEELEFEVRHAKPPGTLWYCIAARDALGRWYRSRSFTVEAVKSNT